MIGLIILYVIVAVIIVLLFLNIYKPSIFNVKKIDPATSADAGSSEKLNQVIATTNSLVEQVKTLSDTVNINNTALGNLQAVNSNQISTQDIENIKSQIQAINSTYVDKTKPVGILAGTCLGGVCNTPGNYYRALTYNDKDAKFAANGMMIPGIGHSKLVDSNKERANYTQWFISQEYPKPVVVAPAVVPVVAPTVEPTPFVPGAGTTTV